jgi:hypothetical protein
MSELTTNFEWPFPSQGEAYVALWEQFVAAVDADMFVEHAADGTHKTLTQDWSAGASRKITVGTLNATTALQKGGVGGYLYVPCDKDGDGDFDALTATAWAGGTVTDAATGTINWNTAFGVPTTAKAVDLYIFVQDQNTYATSSGTFSLQAKSSTTTPAMVVLTPYSGTELDNSAIVYARGTVPISAAGTSFYSAVARKASGTMTVSIRVVGYYL